MPKFLRRLLYLVRQRRLEADLMEEIEAHRALRQHDLEERGLDPAAARTASRRALGNATLAREDARAVWVPPSIDSMRQDCRYALRTLLRQPGFTVVAAVTIAIGVAVNTSLFTVFSALALRPWPVPEPARVVRALSGPGAGNFSSAAVAHFAAHSTSLEGVFAARTAGNNVIGEDDARVAWVSGDYFRVLRTPLALGRPFTAADDRRGAPPVAVLSHRYWQHRFGSDASIAGKAVEIEATVVTVLGVAAREFTGTSPDRTDLWMPLSSAAVFRPTDRWVGDEVLRPRPTLAGSLMLGARLKPDVTAEHAAAELTLLAGQLQPSGPAPAVVRLANTTFLGGPTGAGASAYPQLFLATLLVLLLACANVANLLLARGVGRRREMAVRLALGAGRRRVIRQLLTESLVLALLAGAAAVLLAAPLPALTVDLLADRPTALQLQPDALVIGFAFALSAGASVLFGLVPALHATRASISDALKDAPMVRSRTFSLRAVLLTIQVAFSVVLLGSAALLVRGVMHAGAIDHGFDIDGVTFVSFDVPRVGYDAERTRQFSRDLADALAAGGELAALTQALPLGSGTIKGSYRLTAAADAEDEANSVYEISPRYLDVLGIPLVAGRMLGPNDTAGNVVVVNETLARRIGTPASVVGRRIHVPHDNGFNAPGDPEIVGVVRDAHTSDLLAPYPTLYQPYTGRALPMVIMRAPRAAALEKIGTIVRHLDPRVRLRASPLTAMVDARLRATRAFAILASAVGLLALVLATVGMFGVFAFWVQQRTREIGIRMALGASRTTVMRSVVRSSAAPIAIGLAIGTVTTSAASGLLRSSLFGLSPLDPIAYVVVTALLAFAGLLATIVPARRAAGVDAVLALRQE